MKNLIVSVFIALACISPTISYADKKMTHEEAIKFYERYIEAANARDFDYLATVIQEDVILNGKPSKRSESVAGFKSFFGPIPDYIYKVDQIVTDGELFAVRLTNTGTPKKQY